MDDSDNDDNHGNDKHNNDSGFYLSKRDARMHAYIHE